ncbi:magnesium protoporphyrin chelatase, partial [mine drainage metagenome]
MRSVREELRDNLIAALRSGQALFAGLVGYQETVVPQVENAILAAQDIIFLGERGQAKSRLIRALTSLLDEQMPVVAGSEVHDHPYAPISRFGRDLVEELGDATPIEWVPRDRRYGEKLATPDTSIADLIGEVDPIRVAEGRYLVRRADHPLRPAPPGQSRDL